jgi:predicted ester cyclase
VAGVVRAYRVAFPDLRIEIEREVADHDHVVQYGFISGTHGGTFIGQPATGKTARFAYMDMHRIVDGMIVESWHVEDIAGMMYQLGLMPG